MRDDTGQSVVVESRHNSTTNGQSLDDPNREVIARTQRTLDFLETETNNMQETHRDAGYSSTTERLLKPELTLGPAGLLTNMPARMPQLRFMES